MKTANENKTQSQVNVKDANIQRRLFIQARRRARSHLSEQQRASGDYRVMIRGFGD